MTAASPFAWSDEHREFRSVLRRSFAEHDHVALARELLDGAVWPRALWEKLCDQLGLAALPLPEEYGGAGFGRVETAVVAEEMGRVLLGGPYLATVVLAAEALVRSGDEAAMAEHLPALASGELLAALAVSEHDAAWPPAALATTATPDGNAFTLTGTKHLVLGAPDADLLVIAAHDPAAHDGADGADGAVAGRDDAARQADGRTPDAARSSGSGAADGASVSLFLVEAGAEGVEVTADNRTPDAARSSGSGAADGASVSLFLVEAGAEGVEVTADKGLDGTRSVGSVALRAARGARLGAPGDGLRVLEAVRENAAVFLAAEQAAGMRACVDRTAAYARERVQFGRPIGVFQGVKHRLADMCVRAELAHSAAVWAAWQEPGTPDAALGASVARAYCSDGFVQNALDAVQLHGGIGITWEHDAHLFLRRAQASAALLGRPGDDRRRLEAHLAAPGRRA